MKYAILLAYDGTDYGGWQVQKNKISVQERVEEAVCAVLGKKTTVTASGRTDSGVHAAGQVCHFQGECSIPPEKLADALNMRLPADISVLKSVSAPESFDANRSAKRKTYCYRMYLSPRRNPLKDRFSVWVKGDADIERLRRISKAFTGVHDFKAYQKSGSQVKTTVREVYSVQVETRQRYNSLDVEIYVCGSGFLYNMVRTMAGTMLYYAQGVLTEDDVARSLNLGDRSAVGKTMPARGLTLESVEYESPLF